MNDPNQADPNLADPNLVDPSHDAIGPATGRSFDLGRTISRGLAIYGRRFIPFTALSALMTAPLFLFAFLLVEGVIPPSTGSLVGYGIVATLLAQLVLLVLFHATVESLRGRPARVAASFRAILPRFPTAIGVAILSALVVGLGMLALIVPGLILLTKLWVAIPAAVIEKTGVTDSMSRSWNLVTGNGWAVFGIILVFWIPEIVPEKIFEHLFETGEATFTMYLVVPAVISVFVSAASAAVTAVGYYDLRVAAEAIDLEDLASAFD